MKHAITLLLVLGGTAMVGCNTTEDDSGNYEVEQAKTVNFKIDGMT